MTPKHTPGPWFHTWLSDENSGNPDYIHISAPSTLGTAGICDLPMFQYGDLPPSMVDKQREANARLIASAPELLEALKIITGDFISSHVIAYTEAMARAKSAIAKAEGRDQIIEKNTKARGEQNKRIEEGRE